MKPWIRTEPCLCNAKIMEKLKNCGTLLLFQLLHALLKSANSDLQWHMNLSSAWGQTTETSLYSPSQGVCLAYCFREKCKLFLWGEVMKYVSQRVLVNNQGKSNHSFQIPFSQTCIFTQVTQVFRQWVPVSFKIYCCVTHSKLQTLKVSTPNYGSTFMPNTIILCEELLLSWHSQKFPRVHSWKKITLNLRNVKIFFFFTFLLNLFWPQTQSRTLCSKVAPPKICLSFQILYLHRTNLSTDLCLDEL